MLTAVITPGGIFISMPWWANTEWANTEWANTEWANTRFGPTWHNIIQLIVNGQLLIVMRGTWYVLRPFAPFAKFAFGHHTKKGRTQGSPLHGIPTAVC